MPPNAVSAEDDYFNDLSRQPNISTSVDGNAKGTAEGNTAREDANIPRQKRVACVVCRKRKLKCDGNRPACGTCSRLGHSCAYDEIRRKSGPKRGYVKELEARLGKAYVLSPINDFEVTDQCGLQRKWKHSSRKMSLVLPHQHQVIHHQPCRFRLHGVQPHTQHTMPAP